MVIVAVRAAKVPIGVTDSVEADEHDSLTVEIVEVSEHDRAISLMLK